MVISMTRPLCRKSFSDAGNYCGGICIHARVYERTQCTLTHIIIYTVIMTRDDDGGKKETTRHSATGKVRCTILFD